MADRADGLGGTDSDPASMSLEKALARFDISSRPCRIERTKWLGQFATPRIVVSRMEPAALLSEARDCYVFGQFVAVLILATAYVEHSLTDMLADRGIVDLKNGGKSKRNLEWILDRALEAGLIDHDVHGLADEVRRIRNPYSHRRRGDDPDGLSARFTGEARHPDAIREGDARKALQVMFAVFDRVQRFDWRSSPLY